MPDAHAATAPQRWLASFWRHHRRRSRVRLAPLAAASELDGWLPSLIEPAAPPPHPIALDAIAERAPVALDHWLVGVDDGQRCAAALRLTAVEPPSFLVLLTRPRPPLKTIEDALIDLCAHHLAADGPRTARLRLHLLARDGWALPIADSLGFRLVEEPGVPARGIATLEINRFVLDGLEQPGTL